jgi:hypothetical protein
LKVLGRPVLEALSIALTAYVCVPSPTLTVCGLAHWTYEPLSKLHSVRLTPETTPTDASLAVKAKLTLVELVGLVGVAVKVTVGAVESRAEITVQFALRLSSFSFARWRATNARRSLRLVCFLKYALRSRVMRLR